MPDIDWSAVERTHPPPKDAIVAAIAEWMAKELPGEKIAISSLYRVNHDELIQLARALGYRPSRRTAPTIKGEAEHIPDPMRRLR